MSLFSELQDWPVYYTSTGEAALYLKKTKKTDGINWISLKDDSDSEGLTVLLIKANKQKELQHISSNEQGQSWIGTLKKYGLVSPCIISKESIDSLKIYVRLRYAYKEMSATHLQSLHDVFATLNINLYELLKLEESSILKVVEAIIAGEKDVKHLLNLCQSKVPNDNLETLIAPLINIGKKEFWFMLQQVYKARKYYNKLINRCDRQIGFWLEGNFNQEINLDDKSKNDLMQHFTRELNDDFNDIKLNLN